jgi:acetoin:2,6-dichlorophenolindophenol oxidoreductase subunit beta
MGSRGVKKTGRAIVVAEEANRFGVAAEVATSIQESVFDYLDAPVLRVTQPHSPIPHSPPRSRHIERAVRRSTAEWPAVE